MNIQLIKKENHFEILLEENSVGSISFMQGTTCWFVSYFIKSPFRGQGIISQALSQALLHYSGSKIKASVENSRFESIKVLLKNGFIEKEGDEYSTEFEKQIP